MRVGEGGRETKMEMGEGDREGAGWSPRVMEGTAVAPGVISQFFGQIYGFFFKKN